MPPEYPGMDCKTFDRSFRSLVPLGLALSSIIVAGGCSGSPHMRVGAFFGSPGGMSYPDPAHLGTHNYLSGTGEKNGLVYTCRGGFIDIGHVREAADRAAYLAGIAHACLAAGRESFSYRVIEPSWYHVKVGYPAGWADMSAGERARLASQAYIPLAQYLAHKSLVWHEIITWYGFSSTGVFSEKISSFSFEDTYSDATGVYLAGRAILDDRPYDAAMTSLLEARLRDLGAQSPDVARLAVDHIRGDWYAGELYFFTQMTQPSFDVGLVEGCITPRLVPEICPEAVAVTCPVPNLDAVSQLGFSVSVEIEPAIWEQDKIYHSIHDENGLTRIQPETHFPELINYISSRTR